MTRNGKLFIVRHGESGWNRRGLVQGQSPAAPGLTEIGWGQAVAIARDLMYSGATIVVASDLQRARQTAAPIAARLGVSIQFDQRLRERALGTAEGQSTNVVGVDQIGVCGELITDADLCLPGGESLRDLYDRIAGLLSEVLETIADRRIVLVTHGGPVRVARAWLAGIGVDKMPWSPVTNGSVLEVAVADLPYHPIDPVVRKASPTS